MASWEGAARGSGVGTGPTGTQELGGEEQDCVARLGDGVYKPIHSSHDLELGRVKSVLCNEGSKGIANTDPAAVCS